jgi:HK97 family phage prohead protease
MAEHKQFLAVPLEDYDLKAGEDGWVFSAYASTYNNRDHGGDVIDPKAFEMTLKSRTWRPLLWQHDMREPIGIEQSLKSDRRGLLGTWELIDTQRGSDAYKLLKRGAVRSMSIGYIPQEWEWREEGETRLLKSVDLLENSVVSIPMNEQAQVTSVKHGIDLNVPFEELIAQVKAALLLGADEAEALFSRRVEDERKLSQAHIDVLTLLDEELKGSQARIEAILSAARAAEAPEGNAAESLRVRLALYQARQRARSRGVENHPNVHESGRSPEGDR